MNDELITVDELAKKLKVPKSWVYSRTREIGPESIPRVTVGKYKRFRLNEVFNWLEKEQS